ncbi:MAG: GNAT family N-acetyltransferase [Actinomycetota bacterium]|nr:GNAT family N-acetyltransferase [Actinomycetota bacterium]
MAQWKDIELDDLVLHSGRLTLRPWQAEDASAVQQIMTDERMVRYLPLPWPYTAADATEFVTELGVHGRQAGNRLDCAIAENTGGAVVGSASIWLTGGSYAGEIGYWVSSRHWGRGYAGEAVQTLSRFGFAQGLGRIRIVCETANLASARVALRSGYRYEGISRGELPGRDGPRDGPVFARTAADPGEPVPASWPPMSELSDGVVTVRPLTAEDWPTVLAEGSNDESLGWGFGGTFTKADAIARSTMAPLDWLVGRQANMVICDAATGAGAGTLTFRHVGPPNVVGIGYGIVPEFRGRRFTSRALNLVSEWAFSATPIVRLELGCKVGNLASARSAEAAGFVADARYTGRLRNPDGSYSDEIGYGRVRPS